MFDAHTLHVVRGLLVMLALLGALALLDEAGAKLSGARAPIAGVAPVWAAR
jgi:hypothetical protein